MKKTIRRLSLLALVVLAVGLMTVGVFAGESKSTEFPALRLDQYTEVPIDDPAPGNDLVGICTFNPPEDGYYRIQYTSAMADASITMIDSDDCVSNALREDYSVKEWTIYGVYYLTAGTDWLFEVDANYDSMQVLVTEEKPEWITELPDELPVNLYESANLYAGFRLPSQKKPGTYYAVTERNFPANVAKEEIQLLSGGEFIELEQVEKKNSAGKITSSYYKITGIAPGTATLRLTTTYCGQTRSHDILVNVTELIVKATNITDEMELETGKTLTPELVVYHRSGNLNSYTDIETDAVLTYVYLSEGEFQHEGQTVKALSVDGNGCYTAKVPGFGIMKIEAYNGDKLIAELGYNIIVTAAPNCETNGHSYGAGVVTREAKYLTPGTMSYTCTVCGRVKTEEIPTLTVPFTDVNKKAFYYTPMLWALDENITKGTSATKFEPDGSCTRGQVVTFLWRAAGSPEPQTTENPFIDVEEGRFYYKAVLWAAENGITAGITKTTFEPDSPCTRSQVVTFLWRAAGKPKPSNALHSFTDVKSTAFYYKAMLWAVENGITMGISSTKFDPDGTCTRGQVVTFLYRYKT